MDRGVVDRECGQWECEWKWMWTQQRSSGARDGMWTGNVDRGGVVWTGGVH